MKGNRNLLTHRLLIIKLAAKGLQNTKFYAILLVFVMLVGIFGLSSAISSLMNDVIIRSTGRIATATTAPMAHKGEIRGVFIQCGTWSVPPDWDVIAQTLKDYKIDVVYGEFLSIHGGYYDSVYSDLGDIYGNQLGQALTALHSRGIEVHVSMDVVYVPKDSQTELQAIDSDGNPYPWTCPTKQATRAWIKNLVEELVTKYDIDGFMFDYIRYDSANICYGSECKAKFEEYLEETIVNWPGDFAPSGSRYKEFMEWRVIPITELVRDMRNWMLAIKPDLEFSVAAWTLFQDAPTYWRYWIGQDTADWVRNGYLDAVAPMMYTTNLNNLEDYILNDFKYMVGGPEGKVPLLPLITTGVESPVDPNAFKAVVDKVRSLGADGWIIWRYGGPGSAITPDIRDYLSLIDMPDVFSLRNIQVSTVETNATVTWTTDLLATSKVEYSTSPLFNASFEYKASLDFHYWNIDHIAGVLIEDNTPVTNHSITLTSLLPGTKYYFRVQSEGSGGIATSKVLTFTTG